MRQKLSPERKSAILECVQDIGNLEFLELRAKLELRFDERNLSQNFYLQFTNLK